MTPSSPSRTPADGARLPADLVDSLHVGVLLLDPSGRVERMNRTAERLLLCAGATRAAGVDFREFLPPESVVREAIEETFRDGRAVPNRVGPVSGARGARTVRCITSILRSAAGETEGVVCELQDVTSTTRLEEELHQLDRLATVGRFASTIAHEIRNPLTGIFAGIQFLEKTLPAETEEQRMTYQIVQEEVERLGRVVTDMLEAARPPKPKLIESDPNRLLEKVARLLAEDARRRRVRVVLAADDTLPRIRLDPDLISQVLLNLGRNAVEASPPGGSVTMETSVSVGAPTRGILPRSGTLPGMEFRVRDEGPGVPPDDRERIFEPFHTSKDGGTGLGLYISFQIMERHGGALWVRTGERGGAEFVARVPYLPVEEGSGGCGGETGAR
ncbi:MAG: PAS domain-containing protein [Candidatus Eisenbacteria bacterium]|nr:PAS domain-containing protein [Candidatus Eisenbacteria bacterium]